MASSAALLSASGCRIDNGEPPELSGGKAGAGTGGLVGNGGASATGGSGGTGGTTTTGGSTGVGGAFAGSGGVGTGGAAAGSGGVGTGGTLAGSAGTGVLGGSGGMSAGGMGGAAQPCVDVEPPPDPEWPGATCQNWATETTECTAPWFANYCNASCGRCTPAGAGGAAGAAGSGGGGGMGGRPCVNVEPPPDPEWPDATCETWATETTECTAPWFANYCDVSCGRCTPAGAGGAGGGAGAPGVDCSTQGLPNVSGGNGYATRYWDCCQPHCAQFDGHRCGQDGVSSTGNNMSACSGGGSFACYDEAPRSVSECLSYGHIAKANPNCGGCFRIQFTGEGQHNANDPGSKLIKGKQMIVKVTNTGSDVNGNQFDLMIPGGGVGQFNACSRQWGANDLGAQYGGFLSECTGSHAQKKECVRQECMKIPAGKARDGCIWFVDWFQVADNPKFTSESTNCPF
jgi:hypothetical protein